MIEVVLKKNVEKLGKLGEIVRVADGYARNYLIPKDLAAPATREAVESLSTGLFALNSILLGRSVRLESRAVKPAAAG